MILILITLLFSVRSVWRTEDWQDKETLYGHDMEFLHESVKANMLYGALISKKAFDANFQSRVSDGKGGVQIDEQKHQEAQQLFAEARDYYKTAAELAPYYHTAWSNLGTGYYFTEETRPALSYFLKAVKIKDDYAEGWFNVGMAYDKLDMTDSSVYGFSKCIMADSSYVSGYEHLSRILAQKKGEPEKALSLLKRGAVHKPDSDIPWSSMSSIYIMMKDTAASVAALEMAAQINPNNLQRLYKLAQYYQAHGDQNKSNQYMSLVEEGKRKQEKMQREQQKRKGK